MNIEYSNDNSQNMGNSISYFYNPQELDDLWVRKDLESQYRSEHDPEKPPKWKPGDIYIVIGTVVGLIVGGILGFFGVLFGIVGDTIAGGIIGATIGALIKKRRQKTKTNARKLF